MIPVRTADVVTIKKRENKENLPNIVPLSENQRKREGRQERGPYQTTKKAVEHEGNDGTNCYWYNCSNYTKDLERGLEELEIGQIETIQTIALLRSTRIFRGVLET